MNRAPVRLAASALLAVTLVGVIFVSGSFASAPPASPPSPDRAQLAPQIVPVAYIYYTDTVGRDDFFTLLSAGGFQVDLVPLTDTAAFNFSGDRSIILGSDTGSFNTWGTPAAINTITASGKYVLGIGDGGYAFFGQLGLSLGYANGVHALGQAVDVMDPTQPLFRCPNMVSIPPTQTLALYGSDVVDVEIFIPGSVPNDVSLIGRTPGNATHYPVLSQTVGSQTYLLWGFNGTPSAMTQAGRDLFINLVDPLPCASLPNKQYLPLISR